MHPVEQKMLAALASRREGGTFRSLPARGRGVDFSSNDYLGLSAELAGWQPQNVRSAGATGSRLISGNCPEAESLERELAAFHRADSALLYTSGYLANLGLMSVLGDRHDTILYDALIHASLRDGIRLSPAKTFPFRHNEAAQLDAKLRKATGRKFVVVESLYSMDGDEPPLQELLEVTERQGAVLIVDEAHATGVFGQRGEGLVVEKGLQDRIWARIHTFGKAVGLHGAIVVGPPYLRDYLINFSRPFIYTTALPPAQLQAIGESYRRLQDPERREVLRHKVGLFRSALAPLLQDRLLPARGPIQAILPGGSRRTKKWAGHLQERGFDLKAILHPTVPLGKERIRITLHTFNREEDILKLAACLNEIARNESVREGTRA